MVSHALPFGTVAWRLNVFSGAWIAIAAGALVLLAELLGAGIPEAVLAGLTFALGSEAWKQATNADVHAMALACMLVALIFALRALQAGRSRDLVLAALCTGLGLATHPLALFVLPALLIAAVARPQRRAIVPAITALAAPLLLYLYFPLRSAYIAAHGLDPTAAAPLNGAGTIAWDTEHPRTFAGFIAEVTGRQFNAPQHLAGAFAPHHYLGDLRTLWSYVPSEMPAWLIALAAIGLLAVALRRPASAAAAAAAALGITAFAGSVFISALDLTRYLLPVFAIAIAFAAAAAQLPLPRVPLEFRRTLVALVLAAAAGTAWRTNPGVAGARAVPAGRIAIDTVGAATPDGAVIVAAWADATALSYAAFVERSLGTRTIVVGWPHDFTSAYASWTRSRRVVLLVSLDGRWDLMRGRVPRAWLRGLPSPSPRYELFEIRP